MAPFMSIFVVGDYHGTTLREFMEAERPTAEDRLFSLGDFDTVESIHDFLEARERVGEENVLEVAGNHDKAILDGRPVTSRTLKTPSQLLNELQKDETAAEYLKTLTEKPYREFEIGGRKGVLTHSGLTGLVRNPDLSEDVRPFTYRIWEEEHFHDNFDLMEENSYEIMLRGHEHYTEHALRHTENGDLMFNLPDPEQEYSLEDEYLHILTNGAIKDGHYIEINEEEMTVVFKQL